MKRHSAYSVLLQVLLLYFGNEHVKAQCVNETEKPYNRYILPYNASRTAYLKADVDMWEYLNTTNDLAAIRFQKIFDYHLIYFIEDFDNYLQVHKYNQIRVENWTRLERDLQEIEGISRIFQLYLKDEMNGTVFNRTKLQNLCNTYVLSENTSFSLPHIFKMSEYILNVAKTGDKLLKQSEQYKKKLKWLQIPTQVHLRQFYADIAISEFKGYVLVQFCNIMTTSLNKRNLTISTKKSMDLHELYVDHIQTFVQVFKESQKKVDRTLYQPDPSTYDYKVNYERITRFFEVVVIDEDKLESLNRLTCDDYYHKTYTNKLHCEKMWNCQHFDWIFYACPSSTSDQLYTYFRAADDHRTTYGSSGYCGRDEIRFEKSQDWFVYADHCLCNCITQPWIGNKHFSTLPVFSDMHYDKVVVGIRFVKVDDTFYLQIQEGKLKRFGEIDPSTIAWKPIKRAGDNYASLSYDVDGVFLDIIESKDDYVITGVQMVSRNSGIRLAVHFTRYDYVWGKLIAPRETSYWAVHTKYWNHRTVVNYPIYRSAKTKLYSGQNTKVKFRQTPWSLDGGQNTVPAIDIQPVLPNPRVPLSGLQFAYKGSNDHGGLLAPVVITYDLSMKPEN